MKKIAVGLGLLTCLMAGWGYLICQKKGPSSVREISATEIQIASALRGCQAFHRSCANCHGQSDRQIESSESNNSTPARSLASVWKEAPFLKDSSVASVAELLKPAAERRKIFFTGSKQLNLQTLGYQDDRGAIVGLDEKKVNDEALTLLRLTSKQIAERLHLPEDSDMDYRPRNIAEALDVAACHLYPSHCVDTRRVHGSDFLHEGTEYGTKMSDHEKGDLLQFLRMYESGPAIIIAEVRLPFDWDGEQCSMSERN